MSDQNTEQKFRPLDELSYEQARDELIEVVKILELGQMSLDESLLYWERGEELAAYCERYLNGAAERVENALAQREGGDDAGEETPEED
ncbi:MAG: exodeoxyribonuclease VII small subunit [Mycobacteriaceae bacterium]|uniref:exodeoxyribonuclease VII small subunit n=1 Tax=Corynebacterium sp. TaxID=1720 RepID=UPI003F9B049D